MFEVLDKLKRISETDSVSEREKETCASTAG